jgi:hypothetical protein
MVKVPDLVHEKALAVGAGAWLDALLQLVGTLEQEWGWEWGVIERVSAGLLATRVGLQPVGHEMLAAPDRVAR